MDEMAAFPGPEDDWNALAVVFHVVHPRSVLTVGSHFVADHPLLRLCGAVSAVAHDASVTPLNDGNDLPDTVVLAGHLTWHHLRQELEHVAAAFSARASRLPLIVIALEGDEPIPAWLNYAERSEQIRRQRAHRAGVELAAQTFASEQSLQLIWLTATRRMGVLAGPDVSGSVLAALRGATTRPELAMDADAFLFEPSRECISISELQHLSRTTPRVTYVLPVIAANGGVLSVLQLANELFLLGLDVSVATVRLRQEIFRWRFLREPLLFRDPSDLVEGLPECDLAIATHWTTAEWVRDLVASGRARQGAYFLQDYEVWFFPETDPEGRQKVRETYDFFADKIVKSDWLTELMRHDGHATHKISLGMDLGFFFPRAVEKPPRPLVVAMGRPRTPRRGFESIVPALQLVKEEEPEVEIALFGQDLSGLELPFPFRNEGVVFDQELLARLYSSATVHLDGSDFQAFGRPALEAMACGVASVLTDVGGVSEYARHEENCLLVPPREPRAFAEAMIRLLRDEELRNKLRKGGFATVLNYCLKREARETLSLLNRICGATPLPMRARAATTA